MSDYQLVKSWLQDDLRSAKQSVQKYTEYITQSDAFIAEFSATNPTVAAYYEECKANDLQRLAYFQNRITEIEAKLIKLG